MHICLKHNNSCYMLNCVNSTLYNCIAKYHRSVRDRIRCWFAKTKALHKTIFQTEIFNLSKLCLTSTYKIDDMRNCISIALKNISFIDNTYN